ncbi:Trigger factor [Bacteroidales bacterium Barb7]|nr:Trigger factor [Bacteroidales bacterium Barb7]
MNISLKKDEAAVSGIIKLEIVKSDYATAVETSLRQYRQKANIPGFRKGTAPLGMLKKLYGRSILAEEINKLVSNNLYKYIQENKLNVLGEPMPNETEQKELNFETDEDFEFCFDVMLAPEINVVADKQTEVPFYNIPIDDKLIDGQIANYRYSYGTYDNTAEVVEENDLIKGTVTQLENSLPKEDGITLDGAITMPKYIKNEAEKAKFINAALHSTVVFNPFEAYEGAEAEIASFLKIDKEKAGEANSDFSFEIAEITRYKEVPLDQELFDKVFGKDAVANEEEFRNKVKEKLAEEFTMQSDFKFMTDVRRVLIEKAGEMQFAENLLKRWLQTSETNKKTPEQVDEEYPQFVEDMKYQLVKNHLINQSGIQLEQKDVDAYAIRAARAQFAQYGMSSMPDEYLLNYAKSLMKDENTLRNMTEHALDGKFAQWLKEQVTLDTKDVTVEEFNQLFETK